MAHHYGSKNQNKSIPAMLKCAVDGKLEASSMFSNNMLKKRSFDPNAQITCRKHTAGAVTELVCSNCHQHKPVDDFSNAERKTGSEHRCRICVEWLEGDESGYVPLPAPNSIRTPGWEIMTYKANRGVTGDMCDENVDFGDEEDGNYATEAQAGGSSTDHSPWTGRAKAPTSYPNDGHVDARLTVSNLITHNGSSETNFASSRDVSSYHASSAPSAPSAPTDTASTTGTETTARPGDPRRFNAYGPDGQFQKRQAGRAASETSGTSRTTPGSKGWAKVSGRKYPPALPRHMENENPDRVGDHAYYDDDSSDGC
ncbi:hypothetical protein diail_2942 [Diaporthe ilicicola]|nr:hypothetical protein diail_2942 [Diaporthe ilicicola]